MYTTVSGSFYDPRANVCTSAINNSYREITTQDALRDAFLISLAHDAIYTCSWICIANTLAGISVRDGLRRTMNLRTVARKVSLFIRENNLLVTLWPRVSRKILQDYFFPLFILFVK